MVLLKILFHRSAQPLHKQLQLLYFKLLLLQKPLFIENLLLSLLCFLELLFVFGFDALCFEYQLAPFLSFFLHLGNELIVLHANYLLLSGQCLLGFNLKLHVVIE